MSIDSPRKIGSYTNYDGLLPPLPPTTQLDGLTQQLQGNQEPRTPPTTYNSSMSGSY
jgi:hypothetical protein